MEKKVLTRKTFDPKGKTNVEDHRVIEIVEKRDKNNLIVGVEKKLRKHKRKFVDGQVLSNAVLVKRALNGSIIDNLIEGTYPVKVSHYSIDMDHFKNLDINDQFLALEEEKKAALLRAQTKYERERIEKLTEEMAKIEADKKFKAAYVEEERKRKLEKILEKQKNDE